MFSEYPRVALIGDTGDGKTLSMTAIALMYQAQGLKIFANYTLKGVKYEHIDFEDIIDFPEYLHDAVICLDEAHIGVDAYAFFNKRVKDITKFATQTRKRRLIFMYTTQVFTQAAKRLRDLTTYLIYCKPTEIEDVFELKIFDRSAENSYIKTIYLYGKPVYPFYDTNEIITL